MIDILLFLLAFPLLIFRPKNGLKVFSGVSIERMSVQPELNSEDKPVEIQENQEIPPLPAKVKKTPKTNAEMVRAFIEKNKELIKEKHNCEICGGSYSYFNKSKHNKSQKHLRVIQEKDLKERERLIETLRADLSRLSIQKTN